MSTNQDQRYVKQLHADGTWSVVDTRTGKPVDMGSRQVTGMQRADAREILDIFRAKAAT